ncbi:RNA-binding protein [Glaciimonas sp. PCH181]|uniref:RNA-binding protein n=1 Tax=Glaciimonas sp. PCH181 TaxID=2133943 RepID=UPI000D3478E5|nr:RNA-binding protein [Glaciimonas sp. PCH181]PUA19628.1 RNA-binding protein [Glaciimonas sp. PCH181]
MTALYLPVKRVYFDSIRIGTKGEEYRLVTPYWTKRLIGREYHSVVITMGYPKAGDMTRTMLFEWCGYRKTKLTHPHFGPDEVEVFAIDLSERV